MGLFEIPEIIPSQISNTALQLTTHEFHSHLVLFTISNTISSMLASGRGNIWIGGFRA
jgi:hypothetical protein